MRHLTGVVVCVDYADLLRHSIARWREGMDRLIVVTTDEDSATRRLADLHGCELHCTNIFYANGAHFNKGAALAEAFLHKSVLGNHWIATFDADTVPPLGWRRAFNDLGPRPGELYGVRRCYVSESDVGRLDSLETRKLQVMPQSWVIGFFMLFHAMDTHLPPKDAPIFDLCWPHAGNYDTIFCRRWPKNRQVLLSEPRMIHIGRERQNWCGRGNRHQLRDLYLDKRRGWEDWDRERMPNPPTLTMPTSSQYGG